MSKIICEDSLAALNEHSSQQTAALMLTRLKNSWQVRRSNVSDVELMAPAASRER